MTRASLPARLRVGALAFSFALGVFLTPPPSLAQDQTLRFGIGPLQPTPSETKKALESFFAGLAKKLNRDAKTGRGEEAQDQSESVRAKRTSSCSEAVP